MNSKNIAVAAVVIEYTKKTNKLIFDFRFAIFDLLVAQTAISNRQSKIENSLRGMVSMVSITVSKTAGPGSSPGTPATVDFEEK